MEIKCQLDATEVFIADLIAYSICFGHHYAHHQELKSIIQWLLPVVFRAVFFSSSWTGVELRIMRPVCRMLQHPANLYPRKTPDAHCIGGWVGLRDGLDGCGESRPHWDWITGPATV